MIKTLTALRGAFWEQVPDTMFYRYAARKRQNQYDTDTRTAWVDYVDHMQKSGEITEELAQRATL